MRFQFERVLNKPRAEVWRAFDNPDNLKKWQPTLESFVPVSGTPGQVGAVSRLTYQEGKRRTILMETITHRKEPDTFSGTYESSMGKNTMKIRFGDLGDGRTQWQVDAEFEFRGMTKVMAPFFKGAIEKRMRADLDRFRSLLESGDL